MGGLQQIYGIHAVSAALDKHADRCIELHVQSGERSAKIDRICDIANSSNIPVRQIDKDELEELAGAVNHQGLLLILRGKSSYQESDLDDLLRSSSCAALVLALDSVQDPHNLGACLRTAEAMGVDAVIAPKDRACDITPVVRKVASGAAERIPFIRVTNLVRALTSLQKQGLWVTGAAGEAGQSIRNVDFTAPTVIVMGAEGRGLRERTRKTCDYLAAIPMQGNVGSFNVSVACGILLYEVFRQRSA